MKLLPRLRQTRPSGRTAEGQAASGPSPAAEVNHVLLSGILVDEPRQRRSPEGRLITSLLVGFRAPDARPGDRWPSACCEVEVPEGTPQQCQNGELRPGTNVLVSGRLGGGAGGVVATFLRSLPPDPGVAKPC